MPAIHPSVYQIVGGKEGEDLPSFSSIGGYTIIYYSKEEDPYCGECASQHQEEHNPILHAGTYDEGPDLFCTECGKTIMASYGDRAKNNG